MAEPQMIPPYKGVRMIEYHDRIALVPIEWSREFLGLCKIDANETEFYPWEGMPPILVSLVGKCDIWIIVRWKRFENGDEQVLNMVHMAQTTEARVREEYERWLDFIMMSKEELLELQKIMVVPEEDRNYIAERFPLMPPPLGATEESDLYHARLKMLAGMHPKTVALIEEADSADNSAHRANAEFEAVSAYYAEMAHYWQSDEVKAWQRNNPIASEWIKEFARVFQKPKKELDAVDHALVLNWLRKGYHLLTAEELSEAVFQATGQHMTPEAMKKRRERLGLTTKRRPGPKPNSEQ